MFLTNQEKIKLMEISADFWRANSNDIMVVIADYKKMLITIEGKIEEKKEMREAKK